MGIRELYTRSREESLLFQRSSAYHTNFRESGAIWFTARFREQHSTDEILDRLDILRSAR